MFPPDPRMMAEDARPERLHWIAWVAVALGFLLLLLFAVIPGVRVKLYDAAFRQVVQSDTRDRVVEVMGEPGTSREAPGDLHRWWDEEANPGVPAEEIKAVLTWHVRVFFRKVTWQVGLDADGCAVAKHRYD